MWAAAVVLGCGPKETAPTVSPEPAVSAAEPVAAEAVDEGPPPPCTGEHTFVGEAFCLVFPGPFTAAKPRELAPGIVAHVFETGDPPVQVIASVTNTSLMPFEQQRNRLRELAREADPNVVFGKTHDGQGETSKYVQHVTGAVEADVPVANAIRAIGASVVACGVNGLKLVDHPQLERLLGICDTLTEPPP